MDIAIGTAILMAVWVGVLYVAFKFEVKK